MSLVCYHGDNMIVWREIEELTGILKLIEGFENDESYKAGNWKACITKKLQKFIVELSTLENETESLPCTKCFKYKCECTFDDKLNYCKHWLELLEDVQQRIKIYNHMKVIIPIVIEKLKHVIEINILNEKFATLEKEFKTFKDKTIIPFEDREVKQTENCVYLKHRVIEYFFKYDKN